MDGLGVSARDCSTKALGSQRRYEAGPPPAPPGHSSGAEAYFTILAAAPCTAMIFVWSYLTDGDPGYALVQVSLQYG